MNQLSGHIGMKAGQVTDVDPPPDDDSVASPPRQEESHVGREAVKSLAKAFAGLAASPLSHGQLIEAMSKFLGFTSWHEVGAVEKSNPTDVRLIRIHKMNFEWSVRTCAVISAGLGIDIALVRAAWAAWVASEAGEFGDWEVTGKTLDPSFGTSWAGYVERCADDSAFENVNTFLEQAADVLNGLARSGSLFAVEQLHRMHSHEGLSTSAKRLIPDVAELVALCIASPEPARSASDVLSIMLADYRLPLSDDLSRRCAEAILDRWARGECNAAEAVDAHMALAVIRLGMDPETWEASTQLAVVDLEAAVDHYARASDARPMEDSPAPEGSRFFGSIPIDGGQWVELDHLADLLARVSDAELPAALDAVMPYVLAIDGSRRITAADATELWASFSKDVSKIIPGERRSLLEQVIRGQRSSQRLGEQLEAASRTIRERAR
jgi:hypothetical protein